jgi:hypothetical protein
MGKRDGEDDEEDEELRATREILKTLRDKIGDVWGEDELDTEGVCARRRQVLERIVKYVRAGGTVVLVTMFNSHFPWVPSGEAYWRAWGLPWAVDTYARDTFQVHKPFRSAVVPSRKTLPETYNVKAVHLKNVRPEHALYVSTTLTEQLQRRQRPGTASPVLMSPVCFAALGHDFVGFVGDVNAEPKSSDIVLALCGLASGGNPRKPPRDWSWLDKCGWFG